METSNFFTAWWRAQLKNLPTQTYENILQYIDCDLVREEFMKNPSIPEYLKEFCLAMNYYKMYQSYHNESH